MEGVVGYNNIGCSVYHLSIRRKCCAVKIKSDDDRSQILTCREDITELLLAQNLVNSCYSYLR